MPSKLKVVALTTACAYLSACAPTLTSRDTKVLGTADRSAGRADGEVYFLPKAIITAHVNVSSTRGILVTLDAPTLVAANARWSPKVRPSLPEVVEACNGRDYGDEAITGPFALNHQITGFHKDEITVEVENSLLKTVNGKSDEQVSLVLTKLAETAGAYKAEANAASETVTEILTTSFDPTDCASVGLTNKAIRDAIKGPGRRLLEDNSKVEGAVKLDPERFNPDQFKIALDHYEPFRFPTGARPTASHCAKGICVPVLTPATVTVTSGDYLRRSAPISLPNLSDPAVVPVARSPFANVDTKLTLNSGVLAKRVVVRNSEVLTIVSIPATLLGAYLDGVTSSFTKRKTAFSAEKAYRDALDDAAEAEKSKLESEVRGRPMVELGIAGASRGTFRAGQGAAPLVNTKPPPPTESNDGQ
jgi:hypothetical protein